MAGFVCERTKENKKIMNKKFKGVFVLFLLVVIQAGYCMPQGFFSQGLSIPKLVSWSNNNRSLTILPQVKVASPIKSHYINVFGEHNAVDENTKIEQQQKTKVIVKAKQNLAIISHPKEKAKQSNDIQDFKLPNYFNDMEQLISKIGKIDDDASDTVNDEIDVTTESLTETTTDIYETTTDFDDGLLNRASPQLVASLLG